MGSFDVDRFEERAAIMEHCGGMTKFQAETEAAKAQGMTRWQAMAEVKNADSKRDTFQEQDHGQAPERHNSNHMPGMQRQQAEAQIGTLLKRDIQK